LIYTANIAQITVQWMLWRTNGIHTEFIADVASQYLSNVESGLVVERKGITWWETCQISVTERFCPDILGNPCSVSQENTARY